RVQQGERAGAVIEKADGLQGQALKEEGAGGGGERLNALTKFWQAYVDRVTPVVARAQGAIDAWAKKAKEKLCGGGVSLLPGSTVRGSSVSIDIPHDYHEHNEYAQLNKAISQNIFQHHNGLPFFLGLFPGAIPMDIQQADDAKEHGHGKSGIDDVAHELTAHTVSFPAMYSADHKHNTPDAIALATSKSVWSTVGLTNDPGEIRSSPNQPAARLVNTSAMMEERTKKNGFTTSYPSTGGDTLSNFSFFPRVYAAGGEGKSGGCVAKPIIDAVARAAHAAVEPPVVTITTAILPEAFGGGGGMDQSIQQAASELTQAILPNFAAYLQTHPDFTAENLTRADVEAIVGKEKADEVFGRAPPSQHDAILTLLTQALRADIDSYRIQAN
ncbi:MAG: hypothetical protein AAB889_03135, partial [Patescibacteria group bacterium]